jgi:hypothetical protein
MLHFWNLCEKEHSFTIWKELNPNVDQMCAEYFNGLLERVTN